MDVLNAKVWEKYQNLKKRKASEAEELHAEIEEKVRKYQNVTEEVVEELRNENNELHHQIFLKEDECAKSQALLMEERRKTKELSIEVQRLRNLVDSKEDCLEQKACNETAVLNSPCCSPELSSENAHMETAKNLILNSSLGHKGIQNKEVDVSCNSSHKEQVMHACCRLTIATSGGTPENCAEKCVFHSLLESIVGLRFSIDEKADVPHFSVAHQSSGYSFKLVWLPSSRANDGEWFYQISSLGTLERVALGWMREDITFSSTMFPLFFQRMSRALGGIQ